MELAESDFVLIILALITILATVIVSQVLKTTRAKMVSMAQSYP